MSDIDFGKNLWIDAVAGAGKTYTSKKICEYWSKLRKKTAYFAFNSKIVHDMKKYFKSNPFIKCKTFDGHYSDYLLSIGVITTKSSESYISIFLRLEEKLMYGFINWFKLNFNNLIIDEAQDIVDDPKYIKFLGNFITEIEKNEGRVYILSDFRQAIYPYTNLNRYRDLEAIIKFNLLKLDTTRRFGPNVCDMLNDFFGFNFIRSHQEAPDTKLYYYTIEYFNQNDPYHTFIKANDCVGGKSNIDELVKYFYDKHNGKISILLYAGSENAKETNKAAMKFRNHLIKKFNLNFLDVQVTNDSDSGIYFGTTHKYKGGENDCIISLFFHPKRYYMVNKVDDVSFEEIFKRYNIHDPNLREKIKNNYFKNDMYMFYQLATRAKKELVIVTVPTLPKKYRDILMNHFEKLDFDRNEYREIREYPSDSDKDFKLGMEWSYDISSVSKQLDYYDFENLIEMIPIVENCRAYDKWPKFFDTTEKKKIFGNIVHTKIQHYYGIIKFIVFDQETINEFKKIIKEANELWSNSKIFEFKIPNLTMNKLFEIKPYYSNFYKYSNKDDILYNVIDKCLYVNGHKHIYFFGLLGLVDNQIYLSMLNTIAYDSWILQYEKELSLDSNYTKILKIFSDTEFFKSHLFDVEKSCSYQILNNFILYGSTDLENKEFIVELKPKFTDKSYILQSAIYSFVQSKPCYMYDYFSGNITKITIPNPSEFCKTFIQKFPFKIFQVER